MLHFCSQDRTMTRLIGLPPFQDLVDAISIIKLKAKSRHSIPAIRLVLSQSMSLPLQQINKNPYHVLWTEYYEADDEKEDVGIMQILDITPVNIALVENKPKRSTASKRTDETKIDEFDIGTTYQS